MLIFYRCVLAGAWCAFFSLPTGGKDVRIDCYRLLAPEAEHDIEQASGLHYGRLGDRVGLWMVCDRNGGRSAGKMYYFSAGKLAHSDSGSNITADEVFLIQPPDDWDGFAREYADAGEVLLAELYRQIMATHKGADGPKLDLEAVTIAPSPEPPHEPRVFVAVEQPYSTVLELALSNRKEGAVARLVGVYAYDCIDEEQGRDFNDGLEGLAPAGGPGELYWAEEGTCSHTSEAKPQLMFRNPRLGRARLVKGRMVVDRVASEALTAAVRAQRQGAMQTLNALAMTPDGRLLAVDRNGGWILRIDPRTSVVTRWLNLYDIQGHNLREILADFPAPRRMPYISIEGVAVDRAGDLWLVDDPAMPENFRASCLIRIRGLNVYGEGGHGPSSRPDTTPYP
ncbi:MAG: esterase-like activity of phytase family protein [Phycisphaerales bacterium]|nr:esterase-like activity of phytase family protein [Phycisphaerales bacterium]